MSNALRKDNVTRSVSEGSILVTRADGQFKSIDTVRMPDGSTVHVVDRALFERAVQNAMAARKK